MKKMFIVSDIHGHYQELLQALETSGFDQNNDDHLLVVLGDIFDRGGESMSVYIYLKDLSDQGKAIVLKGNHEPMFIDWLEGDYDSFNYKHNGLNETIDDFLHSTSDFKMYIAMHSDSNTSNGLQEGCTIGELWYQWCIQSRKQILEEYPGLLEWLKTRPDYLETSNYILTHGSIDGECPNWYYPHKEMYGRFTGWEACAWDDGSFFNSSIVNTYKKVVIGHFSTGHLREKYGLGNPNDYSILTRKDGKVIAIDACTILTKRVNVLVLEGEDIINEQRC